MKRESLKERPPKSIENDGGRRRRMPRAKVPEDFDEDDLKAHLHDKRQRADYFNASDDED